MDTRSLQTAPVFAASTNGFRRKKLSKREKKLEKKIRKMKRKGNVWTPIDKTNCITLHLVHRSTNDPLLNVPNEQVSEWVLEPEVNCRSDFNRVQNFFTEFELEDVIPHSYRSDDFIEKTSAKSMPILASQRSRTQFNPIGLRAIHEAQYDDYNYEQHYQFIDDCNMISINNDEKHKKHKKHKKRLKDGVEILEQYTFDEQYEDDDEDDEIPQHLKEYQAKQHITDKELEHDPCYRDYIDLLLLSDDDEDEDAKEEQTISGDLQDDFVLQAMGVDEEEFGRIQIGSFEPYGARFAKWSELDVHYDKYKDINGKSGSLYDQTISHLMNIQNAKEFNYLDDIEERSEISAASAECGQFDDAEDDLDACLAYDPEKSLLDNQFEIMLKQQYGDEFIGELDDDIEDLRGDSTLDAFHRFSNRHKKQSLRYQYYMYRKNKKRRIRTSLKRHNREATLQLMGVKNDIIKDLDSDDEKRINAEIDEEFKKEPPPKWDVESILSTRTNHENHPVELKVNVSKQKTVADTRKVLDTRNIVQVNEKKIAQENEFEMISFVFGNIYGNGADANDGVKVVKQTDGKQIIFEFDKRQNMEHDNNESGYDEDGNMDDVQNENVVNAFSKRKGESKEEKKLRKKLQKQMKQKRRKEKKIHKMAFKEAKKKQTKLGVTQTQSHGNALRL